MPMSGKQVGYFSYLMRLWREDGDDMLDPESKDVAPTDGRTVWRASLESALTGGWQTFANLDDLFAFLRRKTGAVSDSENDGEQAQR
jgi:hypothetical protein